MKIAVDATALYGRYNGVEYALWNLLSALRELDQENHYVIYVPRDGPSRASRREWNGSERERWQWKFLPFRGRDKMRRIWWQQAILPRQLLRDGCRILHAPTYVMPLRATVPTLLTVYDLIALTHPQFATRANRLHYSALLGKSLARATCISVPSETVKRAVVSHLPAAARKTHVVPLGVEPIFRAPVTEEIKGQVRARYALPDKFLLFVGNFEPKKNLRGLMRALELLPQAPPLVLAGGARAWNHNENFTARMQTTGYVERRDLPALYAMCEVFVFPSLAEGFGLPVLEALACGAAVVTSAEVPLPDLSSAALICDARDPASIARAIERVLNDQSLRDDLRVRARRYAEPFGRQRTAQMTLDLYRSLI